MIVANFRGFGFGSMISSGCGAGFGCTGLMIGRGVGLANMRPPDEAGLFTGVIVDSASAASEPKGAVAVLSPSVCAVACATSPPNVAVAVVSLLIIAVACASSPCRFVWAEAL